MDLLNNFDIFSDFYSDPQIRLIFQKEYEEAVPSPTMWALMLYYHPKSKYYELDSTTRLQLIEEDYLHHKLVLADYEETSERIHKFLVSKVKYLLAGWETKLEERDTFMHSKPYDESTFEMLDKMMSATAKMWDQYLAVRKKALEEDSSTTLGDVELSLSDQGII